MTDGERSIKLNYVKGEIFMRNRPNASLIAVILLLIVTFSVQAQQEPKFIEPGRPGIANPAEFQQPGVLQLEYGYDGNFRADEFRSQHTLPLALRFAASNRVLLEFDLDTVISETDQIGVRSTGIGDTRLGVQVVAAEESESHPALAFAYYIKLPTADETEELGTGRIDHRIVALISKQLGERTELDINLAYLNVGRADSDRRASGAQAAFSITQELNNDFSLIGELGGQTEDDVQPRGAFALGAFRYEVNRRFSFDAGARFGLDREAPRVGFFAGFTVGVADLFRRNR